MSASRRAVCAAFFQYNADILGEDSINADAEVICLLVESLRSFGLTSSEFKLRLGDRNLWVLFLQSAGVEAELLTPVLSVVDKFEKVVKKPFRKMMKDHCRVARKCRGFNIKNTQIHFHKGCGFNAFGFSRLRGVGL